MRCTAPHAACAAPTPARSRPLANKGPHTHNNSLTYTVGYFDDPPSIAGLAHFLEHAVHLGSDAFPGENDYKLFLAQHGGSSNASTSGYLSEAAS